MKIHAPVKDFNGFRNNVRFVNGVGETDNPTLIDWFKSRGYGVSAETPNTFVPTKVDEVPDDGKIVNEEPDLESMTSNELRDWMKENGYARKIGNIRNKEKLLEIVRG